MSTILKLINLFSPTSSIDRFNYKTIGRQQWISADRYFLCFLFILAVLIAIIY